MSLRMGLLAGLMIVLAAGAPAASAKALDTYELVGSDPSGDGVLPLASGANWPACGTGFGCTKYDVVSLEIGTDGTNVHFKLAPAASYWGTGGVLYVVHFEAAGKKLYTCWAIHSVGLSSTPVDQADQENLLGCSRFAGETQVGPATRAAGIEASTAAGKIYVDWPVPVTAIGEGVTELTNIVAEIWARGPSTSSAGSTTTSQYLWNRADRAPDTGAWVHSLGPKPPSLNLSLTAMETNVTVRPGEAANFDLTASAIGNGTADVAFNATDLPEGWKAVFEPANATVGGEAPNASVVLSVSVPAGTPNGTYAFAATATSAGNLTAALNLTVVVSSLPANSSPAANSTTGTTTTSAAAPAAAEGAGGGIPAPGVLLAAMAIGVAALRRRRT